MPVSKKIKDLDILLAGRLAEMLGTVGDVKLAGSKMAVPVRDREGSTLLFEFDISGLADRVASDAYDAVSATSGERGCQHAVLTLIASSILEDHNDDWDIGAMGEVVFDAGESYAPISIHIESLGGSGSGS